MEYDYMIITESTANLPAEMIEKYEIPVLALNYYVDGEEVKGYQDGKPMDLAPFYTMMREKKSISTAQVGMDDARAIIEPCLRAGKDVLYLGFSSGLSGTYQAVSLVIQELGEEYPQRKIYGFDSRAAALGEGLLVYYLVHNREQGMSLAENYEWLQEHWKNACHWFTVDELFFQKRGGRISASTAVIGTALNIKPVLHVDDEGHLIAMGNVRGRRKSLDALVKHMEETVIEPDNQTVFISHGDCLEDAEYVAKKVREKFPVQDVVIHILDPVIGAHSGPGTVALFFMGTHR